MPADMTRGGGRSPVGSKGVFEQAGTLRYRLVDDSPYTRAGFNSLSTDGMVLWYAASANPGEAAAQEAASASRRPVLVTRNPRMRSGMEDEELGWYTHTSEKKAILFRGRRRTAYRLVRLDRPPQP